MMYQGNETNTMSEKPRKQREPLSNQERQQIRAALRFLVIVLACVLGAAIIAGIVVSLMQ
jgi:cell division septal protein FtsQ